LTSIGVPSQAGVVLRGALEPQKRTPSLWTVQDTPSAVSIAAWAADGATSPATKANSVHQHRLIRTISPLGHSRFGAQQSTLCAQRGMRFFVTGAHGFIGRAIVDRLRERGDEVRGVDLLAGDDPAVLRGDVSLPGEWHAHASGCEVVIHTAALVGFYSSPRGYWEANVVAPRRVLDAAVAGGARRFVHLSSIVVFGFDFDGEVDERAPVRPNGVHYVDTKIASEQTVLAAHAAGEIDCTIVRPGMSTGPARARGRSSPSA
jgi:hypothetical protein